MIRACPRAEWSVGMEMKGIGDIGSLCINDSWCHLVAEQLSRYLRASRSRWGTANHSKASQNNPDWNHFFCTALPIISCHGGFAVPTPMNRTPQSSRPCHQAAIDSDKSVLTGKWKLRKHTLIDFAWVWHATAWWHGTPQNLLPSSAAFVRKMILTKTQHFPYRN